MVSQSFKLNELEFKLKEFFTFTRVHVCQWTNSVNDAFQYIKALKNLSDQFRVLKSDKWDDGQFQIKFPGVLHSLELKVLERIEKEMYQIYRKFKTLTKLNKMLIQKRNAVELMAYQQDLTLNTSFGVLLPPFYQLVEYAEDFVRCYLGLYLEMDSYFSIVDYTNEKSINNLENAFKKASKTDPNIQYLMALTVKLVSDE